MARLLPRSDYARRVGISGRIITQFVVNEEGCVVEAEIIQSLDARLEAEILRTLRASRFIPGINGGRAVAVVMTLPFSFRSNK